MKYLVYGIFDKDENDLPVQEVEANSSSEAKLLAAAQAGGYWSNDTEAICPERQEFWDTVARVIKRKDDEIAKLRAELSEVTSLLSNGVST